MFLMRAARKLSQRRIAFIAKFLMDAELTRVVAVNREPFEQTEEVTPGIDRGNTLPAAWCGPGQVARQSRIAPTG